MCCLKLFVSTATAAIAALFLLAPAGGAEAAFVVTFSAPGVRTIDAATFCADTTECYYGTEGFNDTGVSAGSSLAGGFTGSFNPTRCFRPARRSLAPTISGCESVPSIPTTT
jgi:hypothetical protein